MSSCCRVCAAFAMVAVGSACSSAGSGYGTINGTRRPTTTGASSPSGSGTGSSGTSAGTVGSTGGSTGSSSSGAGSSGTTTGGKECVDTSTLQQCGTGQIEFATVLLDGCAGNTPLSVPVQISDFFDPAIVANTDSCGNGYFCVDAGTLLSPFVVADNYVHMVGAQVKAQFSEQIIFVLFCTTLIDVIPNINLNQALVGVEVAPSGGASAICPGTTDGWSFTLSAPDGGVVSDLAFYAGGFGIDPDAIATDAEGIALMSGVDTSLGSVTLVGHFDGGPLCQNAFGAEEFTGLIPLQAGTISYVPFFTSPDVNGSAAEVCLGAEPPLLVTTFSGYGLAGFRDGPAASAEFSDIAEIALGTGGELFLADTGNNAIRLVDATGVVTTLAGAPDGGFADGRADAGAAFRSPVGVARDAAGKVFIADQGNNAIRLLSAGMVTTLAGGPAQGAGFADGDAGTAKLFAPQGLALDSSGMLYIADTGNNAIRTLSPAGLLTTLAGSGVAGSADGQGAAASFNTPEAIVVDDGGNVYVADTGNDALRKIDPSGKVTTLLGGFANFVDGPLATAELLDPVGIALDAAGDPEVLDMRAGVRQVASGQVHTLTACNSILSFQTPNHNWGLASDATGRLFLGLGQTLAVTSAAGTCIASSSVPTVSTYAGTSPSGDLDGPGVTARFTYPWGVASVPGGGLVVADTVNNVIRGIDDGGNVTTLAGDGGSAVFSQPLGVAVGPDGTLYVADQLNHRIDAVTSSGSFSVLAGDGDAGYSDQPGTAARFDYPSGVAVDLQGNVYVADKFNSAIREITSVGQVSTLAGGPTRAGFKDGSGGPTGTAELLFPGGIAVDGSGAVYLADTANNRIRKIAANQVTTLAGGALGYADGVGSAALFDSPFGIAVDGAGNVWVADEGNEAIRKIDPAGNVTTVVGGNAGLLNGLGGCGGQAGFGVPNFGDSSGGALGLGLALDSAGNVFVADTWNSVIRKLVFP